MRLPDFADDSPGFTSYPENDIRTHRQLARFGAWMGNIGLISFGYLGVTEASMWLLAIGIIAYSVCQTMSIQLRLQALEWELKYVGESE